MSRGGDGDKGAPGPPVPDQRDPKEVERTLTGEPDTNDDE